jgi:hypothetical protein
MLSREAIAHCSKRAWPTRGWLMVSTALPLTRRNEAQDLQLDCHLRRRHPSRSITRLAALPPRRHLPVQRPTSGIAGFIDMVDLCLFAVDGNEAQLAPLG